MGKATNLTLAHHELRYPIHRLYLHIGHYVKKKSASIYTGGEVRRVEGELEKQRTSHTVQVVLAQDMC